jgi:hypothetical protein
MPTPTPSTSPLAVEQYFMPAVAAIVVVILLVGIVLALLIRKKS